MEEEDQYYADTFLDPLDVWKFKAENEEER